MSTTKVCNKTCKCKTRKEMPGEFLSEFCVRCGRIWVNMLCGGFRPTDRFHLIPKPLGGIWIGHTFIEDKTGQLAKAIGEGLI